MVNCLRGDNYTHKKTLCKNYKWWKCKCTLESLSTGMKYWAHLISVQDSVRFFILTLSSKVLTQCLLLICVTIRLYSAIHARAKRCCTNPIVPDDHHKTLERESMWALEILHSYLYRKKNFFFKRIRIQCIAFWQVFWLISANF